MESNRLFLSPPPGLGLRLLKRTGEAQPLLIRADALLIAGASTETPSLSLRFARISAAESKTEGTEDSKVSVAFARGIL